MSLEQLGVAAGTATITMEPAAVAPIRVPAVAVAALANAAVSGLVAMPVAMPVAVTTTVAIAAVVLEVCVPGAIRLERRVAVVRSLVKQRTVLVQLGEDPQTDPTVAER